MTRGLPEDLEARLRPNPVPGGATVLRITCTGAAPDLIAITAAAGAPVRLLQAGIDRIQGRAVGRMLIAVAGASPGVEDRLRALGGRIERIGHVAADD